MFTEVKGSSRVFNYRLSARIQQPGVIADVFADLSGGCNATQDQEQQKIKIGGKKVIKQLQQKEG